MLAEHEGIILINFYFGEYMASDMMPWHYRLVWFLITTPVVIILLFISGLVMSGKKIIELLNLSLDSKFEFNNEKFFDFFFHFNFYS